MSAEKETKPTRAEKREKRRENREILLFGYRRYWRHRMPFAMVTMFLSVLSLACDLVLPLLGADIINFYFVNHTISEKDLFAPLFNVPGLSDMRIFGRVALVFAVLTLFRVVCTYLREITLQHNGCGMETEMRVDSYKKLMTLDSKTISTVNSGELTALMDTDNVVGKELYCRHLQDLVDSALVIIISTVFLVRLHPVLLVMPVLFIPFFYVTLTRYTDSLRDFNRQRRDDFSNLCLTVNENLRAVRIVRSFTGEAQEKKRFYASNHRIRDVRDKTEQVSARYNALFGLYNQFAYVITIAVSAFLVIRGHILLGSLSAAVTYVQKIMGQISGLSGQMGTIQYRIISMKRIKEFLELEPAVADTAAPVTISDKPHVRLTDVSLEFDGHTVLKHIDLDIPYGKKVGIMGETGAGKSVLLKSLSRIFDVTSGQITVDGIDVKDIPLCQLRAVYGYVFQEVFLFSRTIDANIAYFDDTVPEEEVVKAAAIAQADNFIRSLPQGYDTIVGERGVGISGGQKQRVSIARALMKHAPILILDDASSALDMTTERHVMEGIKENCPDVSLLISAHRVSSVADCDEILYMDAGEIVERGTLDELLAQDGRFARVYRLQNTNDTVDDTAYHQSEIEKEGGVTA